MQDWPLHASLSGMQRQLAELQRDVRVVYDRDKFAVQMDVGAYRPEEVSVAVHDDDTPAHLVVSGKHEERRDEHGFVSRTFTRRYSLPEDVDAKQLQCSLSNSGSLPLSRHFLQACCRCRRRARLSRARPPPDAPSPSRT